MALEPDVQSCAWGWGAALWPKMGVGFPLVWQTPHPPLEEPRLLTWDLSLPSPIRAVPGPWATLGLQGLQG